MKNSDEKGGTSSSGLNQGYNPKVRIAVIGLHHVGKSALTVRYLTRRYIGEYKSNADLLYRQTLTIAHGATVDIEIVDVSTQAEHRLKSEPTFPLEEMQRADAFVIVYSITDRNSFTFAIHLLTALVTNSHYQQTCHSPQCAHHPHSPPPPPTKSSSIVLLANKNDLEHMRQVDRVEGAAIALQYGCHFNEISVAENTPELYQSFHNLISNYTNSPPPNTKRKFSVSKMLGNLRIGRTSPCQQILSQASIVDTSMLIDYSPERSPPCCQCDTKAICCENTCGNDKNCCQSKNNSSDSSHHHHHSNLSSSICHLKSKIVEFHSLKKRHNSPPICSL